MSHPTIVSGFNPERVRAIHDRARTVSAAKKPSGPSAAGTAIGVGFNAASAAMMFDHARLIGAEIAAKR